MADELEPARSHAHDPATAEAAGARLIAALRAGAFDDLESVFAPDMKFRALLPTRLRECVGATAAADYFRSWFGGEPVLRTQPDGTAYPFKATTRCDLVSADVGAPAAGRVPIQYLLDLDNSAGHCRCEQHAFFTVGPDGRMASFDLVCSGINVVPGA